MRFCPETTPSPARPTQPPPRPQNVWEAVLATALASYWSRSFTKRLVNVIKIRLKAKSWDFDGCFFSQFVPGMKARRGRGWETVAFCRLCHSGPELVSSQLFHTHIQTRRGIESMREQLRSKQTFLPCVAATRLKCASDGDSPCRTDGRVSGPSVLLHAPSHPNLFKLQPDNSTKVKQIPNNWKARIKSGSLSWGNEGRRQVWWGSCWQPAGSDAFAPPMAEEFIAILRGKRVNNNEINICSMRLQTKERMTLMGVVSVITQAQVSTSGCWIKCCIAAGTLSRVSIWCVEDSLWL